MDFDDSIFIDEYLISAGADVNMQDHWGFTPLISGIE